MNCSACQSRLCMTEDPNAPPEPVAAHLRACQACRAWQQRLLRLECTVRMLSVPPVPAFALEAPPPPRAAAAARPKLPRANRRRWLALTAGGAVAALVVVSCGVLLGNLLARALRQPSAVATNIEQRPLPLPAAPDTWKPRTLAPLVGSVLAGNLDLAQARSPRQRIDGLAKIALALEAESRSLAHAGAALDMERLARLYSRVIHEGVLTQAQALAPSERRTALPPIARALANTQIQAEELAAQTPAAARGLQVVAAASRAGDVQLRALLAEVSK
jgi:hypothetical protein